MAMEPARAAQRGGQQGTGGSTCLQDGWRDEKVAAGESWSSLWDPWIQELRAEKSHRECPLLVIAFTSPKKVNIFK